MGSISRQPNAAASVLLASTVVAALVLAGCGGGGSSRSSATSARATTASAAATQQTAGKVPGSGAGASKPFTVSSTLDGKRGLPHRISWVAKPSLDPSQIAKIEFLIDGKLTWEETKSPYEFSEDGGYLVTSWIKPGIHSFSTRAVASDGRVASDVVRARVARSAPLPAGLAGTWHRRIDTDRAPKRETAGNPTDTLTPSGTYTMIIDTSQVQVRFPGRYTPASEETGAGWILDSDFSVHGSTLTALGEVSSKPQTEDVAEAGPWCYPGGPAWRYRWSVTGEALTLKPAGGTDACAIRGFIWAGTWHR